MAAEKKHCDCGGGWQKQGSVSWLYCLAACLVETRRQSEQMHQGWAWHIPQCLSALTVCLHGFVLLCRHTCEQVCVCQLYTCPVKPTMDCSQAAAGFEDCQLLSRLFIDVHWFSLSALMFTDCHCLALMSHELSMHQVPGPPVRV